MGKVRRQRKKFHTEAKSPKTSSVEAETTSSAIGTSLTSPQPLLKSQNNLFEGLQINISSLNKNLSDDVRSVRSFKSVKSESGKSLTKKDKLKLRREMLMKKFEVLKEEEKSAKRKKTPIVGDMNPLHDALPSLESLLKSHADIPYKQQSKRKQRGIEKARKLKKNQLEGIRTFQKISKNKFFKKDPKLVISEHVKALLEQERQS